jgi:hypothetical protein
MTHNIVRVSFVTRVRRNILSLFMAHISAFPILLDDGWKVNGLRVQELKVALVSAGVPEFQHVQSKFVKLSQL